MEDIKPHEAGYMKPPRKNRFKPGESGNPAGRPKLDDPYATLPKVLGRRITVTGETRRMTIREALIRRLRDRALAGDKRAMALQQKILSTGRTIGLRSLTSRPGGESGRAEASNRQVRHKGSSRSMPPFTTNSTCSAT